MDTKQCAVVERKPYHAAESMLKRHKGQISTWSISDSVIVFYLLASVL